jgi:hypothetical protein
MERKDVLEVYGLDPDKVGHNNCGWCIQGEALVVMTKDKDHFSKHLNADPKWANLDNFMWVSKDLIDKRVMHYWFAPLGRKKELVQKLGEDMVVKERENEQAKLIIKSMRKDRKRGS